MALELARKKQGQGTAEAAAGGDDGGGAVEDAGGLGVQQRGAERRLRGPAIHHPHQQRRQIAPATQILVRFTVTSIQIFATRPPSHFSVSGLLSFATGRGGRGAV